MINWAKRLGTTALCVIAGILSTETASADGAGGKIFTGLGDVGYTHNEYDPSGLLSNFDSRTIHASGSALWSWTGTYWNAQGNFGFNSERFDGSPDIAVDTWRLGAGGYWRDQKRGMFGAELNYQSLDALFTTSGVNGTGRGELFLDQATVGGAIAYSDFDNNGIKFHGWDFGAFGKYYADPNLAITAGFTYNNWDSKTLLMSGLDGWSGRGEVEYLIPDCVTSIYASLEYGNYDFNPAGSLDYWTFGFGARFHFDTSGSLQERQRSGPIQQFSINPRLTF